MKKLASIMIFGILANAILHAEQPKLIVQIVIDQLRGDLIQRYQTEYTANGFNYLINHSIDFHNARHPHANTATCVGHATIATGSYPALHGIIDNEWYDRKTQQMMYCMEDLSAKILLTKHSKIEIPGRSAHNLTASTISDEIVLARKGKAFAVSFKDRSAIALAGHAGKAFWFDKANGGFVTSDYYYNNYPQWVVEWNSHYKPESFKWALSLPKAQYNNTIIPPIPQPDNSFKSSFPHTIDRTDKNYFKLIAKTPTADQLTADFTAKLLKQEQIGMKTNQTDYLGISFSSTDGVGHQFGPDSLESEENLLILDKTIAQLLTAIDKQVGLKNTLIILSADHGVNDSPLYLEQHHIAEMNPIKKRKMSQDIRSFLAQRYQLPKEALLSVTPPFVYLNHQIVLDHHLNLLTISQNVAQFLNEQPGLFKAYTLPVTGTIGEDWLGQKINRMAYPNRAGDVYIVPLPNQSNGAKSEDRVIHTSPWNYDSYVPLLFVNPAFKHHLISRPVFTTDIAATIAALLLVKAPSACVGQPLTEVLDGFYTPQKTTHK